MKPRAAARVSRPPDGIHLAGATVGRHDRVARWTPREENVESRGPAGRARARVGLQHADRRGARRPAVDVPHPHVERALDREPERGERAGPQPARAGRALRGRARGRARRAARHRDGAEPRLALRAGRAVLLPAPRRRTSRSTTWPPRSTRTPSCFPTEGAPSGIDPRLRLAANLYNLGLALGLASRRRRHRGPGGRPAAAAVRPARHHGRAGRLPLGWLPHESVHPRRPSSSCGVSSTATGRPGVGAPLAAEVTPVGEGPAPTAARKRIPSTVKVPVTAFLRIEDVRRRASPAGQVRGQLELYAADAARTVTVEGRTPCRSSSSPRPRSPTCSRARRCGTPRSRVPLGFKRSVFPEGLGMMHPYRPGRVPVVLIHGTASSPARWADMVNELQNDPVLRDRIQFWLFTYNTSNPILLSAAELRAAPPPGRVGDRSRRARSRPPRHGADRPQPGRNHRAAHGHGQREPLLGQREQGTSGRARR